MNKKINLMITTLILLLVFSISTLYARGYDKGGMDYDDDHDHDHNMLHDGDGDKHHKRKRKKGKLNFMKNIRFFDKNRDDKITREEAEEKINQIFSDIDTDSNDQVSAEEFNEFNLNKAKGHAKLTYRELNDEDLEKIQERAKKRFSKLDEDSNDYLSKEEVFGNRLNKLFDKLDVNKDDLIEESEMKKRRR